MKNRNYWIQNADKYVYQPYFIKDISIESYCMSLLAKEQPKYVCIDCAREFSYWYSVGQGIGRGRQDSRELFDFHEGNCECCGQYFSLTDVKNYGYFYDGWQDKKK